KRALSREVKIQSLNSSEQKITVEHLFNVLRTNSRMQTPQISMDVSESLDRSFNCSEVFQLVKRSVKTSIGRRRTGLMLGLADLPDYIGAFHQMGSNFIVMNRSLLDQITHLAKYRRYINA